jgi:hypothetical protein
MKEEAEAEGEEMDQHAAWTYVVEFTEWCLKTAEAEASLQEKRSKKMEDKGSREDNGSRSKARTTCPHDEEEEEIEETRMTDFFSKKPSKGKRSGTRKRSKEESSDEDEDGDFDDDEEAAEEEKQRKKKKRKANNGRSIDDVEEEEDEEDEEEDSTGGELIDTAVLQLLEKAGLPQHVIEGLVASGRSYDDLREAADEGSS